MDKEKNHKGKQNSKEKILFIKFAHLAISLQLMKAITTKPMHTVMETNQIRKKGREGRPLIQTIIPITHKL
jgi:hypothetical protein